MLILLILLNNWDCHLSGTEDCDPCGRNCKQKRLYPEFWDCHLCFAPMAIPVGGTAKQKRLNPEFSGFHPYFFISLTEASFRRS